MKIEVRKAKMEDTDFIYQLLLKYSEEKLLLPRSYNQIYDNIRDFFISFSEKGERTGCSSLHIFWKDLAEIRSLAVAGEFKGRGCGRALVNACLEEAVSLGIHKVFALTYQVSFFEKLGFRQIPKEELPQKIWSDCLNCVKFPHCDEVTLLWSK